MLQQVIAECHINLYQVQCSCCRSCQCLSLCFNLIFFSFVFIILLLLLNVLDVMCFDETLKLRYDKFWYVKCFSTKIIITFNRTKFGSNQTINVMTILSFLLVFNILVNPYLLLEWI